LRGAMIAARYCNNEPATRAAMRDGWYRTGDLGVVLDGELYITGRKKERLIVHGRNYYAHDIEAVVSRCPGVKPGRAVALGRANAVTGSEDLVIVAERASSPDPPDDAAVIRSVKAAVFEALGVTAASVHFVPAGSLVKTTSGKLDREHNYRKFVESGR
jgi:acyl-CoA synthetase (AMP-forming)/AMP-acid ligase II